MFQIALKIAAGLAVSGAVSLLKSRSSNPESLKLLLVLAAASGMASLLINREIDANFPKQNIT